jgi:pyruvate,water dikinase
MPDYRIHQWEPAFGREEEEARPTGGVLAGAGVASGSGSGTARVVRSPSEAGDLGTGYVLVCPSTDPGWTPLFVGAAGLVCERGGMLSHGAIVARDFGIPAVVLRDATLLIRDGSRVRVDGSRGRVELLDAAAPATAPQGREG